MAGKKNITGDNNNNGRRTYDQRGTRSARASLARQAGDDLYPDNSKAKSLGFDSNYGANRNPISDTMDAIHVAAARAKSKNSDLPMRGRKP